MNFDWIGRFASAICLLVCLPWTLGADPSTSPQQVDVFTRSAGLTKNLHISRWSTLPEIQKNGAGEYHINLAYDPNVQKAWGGISIIPQNRKVELALPVSPKTVREGVLRFLINGGTDRDGHHLGGQSLQVQVLFNQKTAQGDSVSKGPYVAMDSYLSGKVIDDDPQTWQTATIPLSVYLGKNEADDVKSLASVSFQFRHTVPVCGVLLTDISLGMADAKEAENASAQSEESLPTMFPAVHIPELSQIPDSIKLPPNPKVTIDGPNYIVNGKPRFLAGAGMVGMIGRSIEGTRTPGYAPENNWIYERGLTYESAQRIGFDTFSQFIGYNWVEAFDPTNPLKMDAEDKRIRQFMSEIKLPQYVDFTAFPWPWGGRLEKLVKDGRIAADAVSDPSLRQHWLTFDPDTESGMAMYKASWTYGAKMAVQAGADVLLYELFNEPSYLCQCATNRQTFSRWLEKKYQTTSAMNKTWRSQYGSFEAASQFKHRHENLGLNIDYASFLQDRWIDILKIGIETIKKADPRPNVQVTMQPLCMDGPHLTSFDYYRASKIFNTLQTPTAGGGEGWGYGATRAAAQPIEAAIQNQAAIGGSLTMNVIRSVAPDKPIVNPESYPGHSRASVRDEYWVELMRGCNAGYLFTWDRRAWDWKPNTPQGGDKLAKKFPYLMLNPYAMPPEALAGIGDFRREMVEVQDVAVGRPWGVTPKIALLYSYPTLTYGAYAPHPTNASEMKKYYAAIQYAQYPVDVILEDQIRDQDIQNRYQVIVAGGVDYVEPQTRDKLQRFVAAGGTLILGINTMSHDPYGNALSGDAGWAGVQTQPIKGDRVDLNWSEPATTKLLGTIHGLGDCRVTPLPGTTVLAFSNDRQPQITQKTIGKGRVWFIGTRLSHYHLVASLCTLLERAGQVSPARFVDQQGQLLSNIEVTWMDRGDSKAMLLFNWDMHTKLACLELHPPFLDDGLYVTEPLEERSYVTADGQAQWNRSMLQAHPVMIPIPPQQRVLVVLAKKPWPDRRMKPYLAKDANATYQALVNGETMSDQERLARDKKRCFNVDPNRCFTVDLRAHTNRHFVDSVAGDGQGGWTDQGRDRGLNDIPYGVQTWLNVPFDIIRPDFNNETTCVVLQSQSMKGGLPQVKDIQVQQAAKQLFFLQAVAWGSSKRTQSHTYVVHYADGSSTDIEIWLDADRDKTQTADWWQPVDMNEHLRLAWQNSERHGLLAYRWINPNPQKIIRSIDMVSPNNTMVPIIVAISGERAE